MTTNAGQSAFRLNQHGRWIIYRLTAGDLFREEPDRQVSRLLLQKVTNSVVMPASEPGVAGWRWELLVGTARHAAPTMVPFTFAAAQTATIAKP